ncbi:hypothetical protein ACI2LM_32990 [Paenibacillus lautus]|uniref:hypothetical protein n=1 Tax=Paenibacillus lautus TaxID=1401 RepID=UPI00384EEFCD
MKIYNLAQINQNGICTGIIQTPDMINDGRHIEIENYDFNYYCFRKYEDGRWSDVKYVPDHAQIELSRMEKLEKAQADQDELLMKIILGEI